jgi:endonuclease YncB( thermonuclease family)
VAPWVSVSSLAGATVAKVAGAYVTCRREGVSGDRGATVAGLVYLGGASFEVALIDNGVVRVRPIVASIAVIPPNAL